MSETWRFAVFFLVVLSIWTGMHAYVAWRVWGLPGVSSLPRPLLLTITAFLWLSYLLARVLERFGAKLVGGALEYVGATWMGVLFLLLVTLLALDVVTLFGRVLPEAAPHLRQAAVIGALLLSAVAIVQGARGPVVSEHEVRLSGLPKERDGLVLVAVSDVHLGTLIGDRWLARQVERINALKPDAIAVVGDLVDGNVGAVEPLVPALRRLQAPLGTWAVLGNHEYYAGLDRSVALLERAGMRVLRDRWVEAAPGLVVAGVDDLTARRQFGQKGDPLDAALGGRPPGATVLLSHTPWRAEEAAARGVGLMLSGHTHDGQIWPFRYFELFMYPLMGGRYDISGMTAIVCRGTGTWGPPMRLWRRSELLRITLRAA
jgi:predicted MPP superfamily phosphohydrolase